MSRKKIITELTENNIIQILTEKKGKILNHKQIFSQLADDHKPVNAESLLPTLYRMAESGIIERREEYKFYKLMGPKLVQGVIDISKNGRIFLIVDDKDEDYQV